MAIGYAHFAVKLEACRQCSGRRPGLCAFRRHLDRVRHDEGEIDVVLSELVDNKVIESRSSGCISCEPDTVDRRHPALGHYGRCDLPTLVEEAHNLISNPHWSLHQRKLRFNSPRAQLTNDQSCKRVVSTPSHRTIVQRT